MNERRIARLEEQIKERLAEVLLREIADPRLGMVTITRVKLDREMVTATVSWSCLATSTGERSKQEHLLEHARGFLQREVAKALTTHKVPQLRFRYDESIEGSIRVQGILERLRKEREARGESPDPSRDPDDGPPGEAPPRPRPDPA
ncbi:MAG: 30S ribosome-binding factor RbfA [Planctomycetes bacterium]|nr:30S ribosome-binding factor RbfA [Planctomycetota bacterium]